MGTAADAIAALEDRITALELAVSDLTGTSPAPVQPPSPVDAPPVEIPDATLAGYSVGTAGDWVAQATPWGMDGQPSTSFVRAGIGDGPVGRAVWSVLDRSGMPQVKAFPHIRTGAKPGYSRAGSAFPMRVQGAGGRYAVDVLQSAVSGRGHLAYNLWVMDTDRVINGWANAAPHITAEILVQHSRWGDYSNPHERYPGGRNPAGRIAQGVSFGGAVVSVYRESSGAGGSIPLYLVIPHDGHTITTLDIAELVRLLDYDLAPEDWIVDLEIGPEIVEGDGDLAWSVTVA